MNREVLRAISALVVLSGAAVGCAFSAGDSGGGAGSGGGQIVGGAGSGGGAAGAPIIAKEIAAGDAHTCALLEDGTVVCWGAGDMGQLGDGVSGKGYVHPTPVRVAGLAGVTAIRAGGSTTCAILGDGIQGGGGSIACWGDGRFGQLGDGHAEDGRYAASPVSVLGPATAVDVSVAGPNVCAAYADGSVRCWGLNDPNQWLGFASADCGPFATPMGNVALPCESSPRLVPSLSGATHVASGGSHCCALLAGGAVSCWGADTFGQLGDGMSGKGAHNPVPTPIPGLSGVVALVAGSAHTCVIASGQKPECWGDNSSGQLGIGIAALDSYAATPTAVSDLVAAVSLDASGRTSCAVAAGKAALCWGETSEILMTSPDPVNGRAVKPVAVPGVVGVVEVRTGKGHGCARKATGEVVCWGANTSGQVGSGLVGADEYVLSPVRF